MLKSQLAIAKNTGKGHVYGKVWLKGWNSEIKVHIINKTVGILLTVTYYNTNVH